MSVIGIGNDLVKVSRIAGSLEKFGDRFASRILAPSEYAGFKKSKKADNFLAKRFAVKEAVSKALGTGISQGITWQDIELCHHKNGQPFVRLHRRASDIMSAMKATDIHISISDEAGMVLAFAVLSSN